MSFALAPRTFTIQNTGARPVTINRVAQMGNRMIWAAHTKATRGVWHLLARQAKVPALPAAHIVATPLHADRRTPQDVAACAPEVKAAIDGLVDAGVLPDDNPTFVLSILFNAPRVCGVDGLELTVIEAVPEGEAA